jgi:predicted secreted protein
MSKSVALMAALSFSVLGDMQVSARLGDTVELCLKEPSTTGYRWVVAGSLPSGVTQLASSPKPGSAGIGGSGERCFSFKCEAHGVAVVRFVLRREWAPDPQDQTRTVTIAISP